LHRTDAQEFDDILILKAKTLYEERERLMSERASLLKKKEALALFAMNNKNIKGVYLYASEIHALTQAAYVAQVLLFEHAQARELVKAELIRRGLCTASSLYAFLGVYERG
jgi:hypothetical protein